MCYFNPSSAGQVSIEVKFFFQLQGLISGISSPSPFSFWSPYVVCNRKVNDLVSPSDLLLYFIKQPRASVVPLFLVLFLFLINAQQVPPFL